MLLVGEACYTYQTQKVYLLLLLDKDDQQNLDGSCSAMSTPDMQTFEFDIRTNPHLANLPHIYTRAKIFKSSLIQTILQAMKAVVRLLPALFILQAIFVATTGDARYLREHSQCDEFYAAEEGETLQTISVKCNNIFILDDNPQINDTDDIGPGTVLYMRQM